MESVESRLVDLIFVNECRFLCYRTSVMIGRIRRFPLDRQMNRKSTKRVISPELNRERERERSIFIDWIVSWLNLFGFCVFPKSMFELNEQKELLVAFSNFDLAFERKKERRKNLEENRFVSCSCWRNSSIRNRLLLFLVDFLERFVESLMIEWTVITLFLVTFRDFCFHLITDRSRCKRKIFSLLLLSPSFCFFTVRPLNQRFPGTVEKARDRSIQKNRMNSIDVWPRSNLHRDSENV